MCFHELIRCGRLRKNLYLHKLVICVKNFTLFSKVQNYTDYSSDIADNLQEEYMKKSPMTVTAIALLVGMIMLSLAGGGGLDIIMSTSPFHNAVRALLIGGLLVLALTVRPRPLAVRLGLGIIALTTIGVSLFQVATYSMQLLDTLMYVAAAIVLLIEAVEDDVVIEPSGHVARLGAA